MYNNETLYVIGSSRTNTDNAITKEFNAFFMGFVIDKNTHTIIDFSCTSTIRTTEEFIKTLFLGKKMDEYDSELEEEIKTRYHGSSQKAIIVAYKDAWKKYSEVKQRYC